MRLLCPTLITLLFAWSACASTEEAPATEGDLATNTAAAAPGPAVVPAPAPAPPDLTPCQHPSGEGTVPSGYAVSDGCNSCSCRQGGMSCTMLACELVIMQTIPFGKDSAELDAAADDAVRELAVAMMNPLAAELDLKLTLTGRSRAGEGRRSPVEQRRAEAVHERLIVLGTPRHRVVFGTHEKGADEASVYAKAASAEAKRAWGQPRKLVD